MMFDLDRFQEIWVTITRNKARSFLTGFGVFWGIFMLVIMLGAGHGLERGMMKNIDGFATNSCFMGAGQTSLPYKGFQKGRMWNIHNRDLDILLESVPEIDCLSPILWGARSNNNVVFNDNSGSYNVRGLNTNYLEIEQQRMLFGRFINDIDILHARKVCVIGTTVYEELFPTKGNPIGQYIRINGIYYQIVGVSSGVAKVSIGGRSEESVIIPFTTMQQINNQGDVIHMLAATAKPDYSAKIIEEKMKEVLKANNRIDPEDMQAIWGFNIEEQFNMFNYLFIGIAALIWIVGSGTLFAGIVGVSNIMMVTIKERTKEIGVRRALGAKPRTIMGQIMAETLVLTSIAGMLGLCFGVLCLHLADVYWLQEAENVFLSEPVISFGTAVTSTVILLICGLLAGSVPASRALRIKAIDAIREE
ncbi:MAG: Macrolide export ATP-binding/permease protein MacB [Candidatus Ordinivivax streblomastigis]|uniref:Macrolide export ATP-binding/permease protein MacB n=1 Tax=Candidatus Ordinivivax streblomastigis TaxID=2540710 RepID=A0A5M8P5K1_9BACT|nr:MAG: Macrolide export ATP-binding/permease protein MacB [Candidatus Ordinivivax streblomastigis]